MRTLALTSLIFVAACGGPALDDSSADDLSYGEPLHYVTLASQAASLYAANPHLMHVEGKAGSKTMAWSFTFRGDFGNWATVASDGKTASVIETHHQNEPGIGMWLIDIPSVKITVARLKTIASKNGCSKMQTVQLDQPYTSGHNPHWGVESSDKTIYVDATTGAVTP